MQKDQGPCDHNIKMQCDFEFCINFTKYAEVF